MRIFKTVTIAQVLTNTNIFSVPINIPFQPTHLIVKYVSIANENSDLYEDSVLLLKSSLLNDTMYHFCRSGVTNQLDFHSHSLDLKFNLNLNRVQGSYDFYFTNISGNIPDKTATNTMEIAMTIEFVQEL